MDLIIFVKSEDKLIRVSEGDGPNLNQEDIDAGYVDYLYYDVYNLQELSDVNDGGMILLEKPVAEQFNWTYEVVNRVLDMAFGTTELTYEILSGEDYWNDLVEVWD